MEPVNSLLLNFHVTTYGSRGTDRFFDTKIYNTQSATKFLQYFYKYPKAGATFLGINLFHNAIYLYVTFVLSLLIFGVLKIILLKKKDKFGPDSRLRFFQHLPIQIFYITLFETAIYIIICAQYLTDILDIILIAVTGAWVLGFLVLTHIFTFKKPTPENENNSFQDVLFDNFKPEAKLFHKILPLIEIYLRIGVPLLLLFLSD